MKKEKMENIMKCKDLERFKTKKGIDGIKQNEEEMVRK